MVKQWPHPLPPLFDVGNTLVLSADVAVVHLKQVQQSMPVTSEMSVTRKGGVHPMSRLIKHIFSPTVFLVLAMASVACTYPKPVMLKQSPCPPRDSLSHAEVILVTPVVVHEHEASMPGPNEALHNRDEQRKEERDEAIRIITSSLERAITDHGYHLVPESSLGEDLRHRMEGLRTTLQRSGSLFSLRYHCQDDYLVHQLSALPINHAALVAGIKTVQTNTLARGTLGDSVYAVKYTSQLVLALITPEERRIVWIGDVVFRSSPSLLSAGYWAFHDGSFTSALEDALKAVADILPRHKPGGR
ncbi:MAG: hypothetical protein JW395_3019 [Nitrospira sp.]|nr:hypothetical protein [Nitrospira sp.]